MWHTDYKQLDDGRWLISYEDDASRFITGWGVFDEATTEHAVEVLDRAISQYGKSRSILSDRGSQFYATESEKKSKGVSEFERTSLPLGSYSERQSGSGGRIAAKTARVCVLFGISCGLGQLGRTTLRSPFG